MSHFTPQSGAGFRVLEGAADVFAVTENGARFPLFRVETGQFYPDCGEHLVVVPTLGARVESAAWSEIEREDWQTALRAALVKNAADSVPTADLLANFIARHQAEVQARLQNRAHIEGAARGQGWQGLWKVLEAPGTPKKAGDASQNPFLAASHACFEAAGIPFETSHQYEFPARFESENTAMEAVKTLSHTMRVRSRAVVLSGNWWREDGGAMLGFAPEPEGENALRPIAFLPAGSEKYRVFDPHDEFDNVLVGAHNAARFSPRGVVWTRPFPTRALGMFDVLRFGVRGAQCDLLWIGFLSLVGGLLGLLPPLVTAQVFDSVLPGAERARLWPLVALLVVFAAVTGVLSAVHGVALLRVESRLDAGLQSALWDRVMRLSPEFFRDFESGDLANRALAIGGVRHLLAGAVVSSLLGGVFSLFNWVLLFVFDVRLALVATLVMLVAGAVNLASGAAQLRHEREKNRLAGEVSGLSLQLLQGVATLQTGGATGRAFGVWAKRFAARKSTGVRAARVQNGAATFDAAFPLLASMALFGAVAASQNTVQNGAGRLSTGEFLAFSVAFGTLLASWLEVGRGALMLLRVVPLLESARPILQATPEIRPDALDPGQLGGAIELSGLSFRYHASGPLILDDVSLSIAPGEFVAFVGPSGSGKSTLLRLILGFETPQSGSIYLDGRDLSALDIDAVRRQYGVVLQQGRMLPGSLYANIAGASNISLSQAWQAAARAGMSADIEAMPMGMHTVVGEGGTFSGGQKQRLLIARALASSPRILLFDEATSALDNLTQAQVSQSLETLDATRVVIAHRLSTIRNADKIFVLAGGKLVESGSYNELMARRGAFAELVARQMA